MNRLRNTFGVRVAAVVLGASILLMVPQPRQAGAHPVGGMVGPHYMPGNPGATCVRYASGRIEASVQPPTVYATPYDAYTSQWVAWQARLVRYWRDGGGSWRYETVASTSQTRLAYDTSPAPFTRVGPLVTTNWSGGIGTSSYYVAIDLYFYDTRTGALASSSSGWVTQYQQIVDGGLVGWQSVLMSTCAG